jgi:hypothetical protein
MTAKALALGSMIALATAFLGGAGCSSSTKASGPPDPSHYASAVATAFCDALKSCCDAGKFKYDATSCTAQLGNNFQSLADVVKHGKAIYDANAAVACAAAFKTREATCSDDGGKPQASMGFIDAIAAACFPVFKGTVKAGEACLDPAECAAATADIGTQCQPDPTAKGAAATVNVCFQVKQHAPPGTACTVSGGGGTMPMMATNFNEVRCEPTTGFCKPTMGTSGAGTCIAYGKIGDACGVQAGDTCDPASMYCDTAGMKCAAIPDVGGDCLASQGACAEGSYCPKTNKCAATLPEGTVCASNGACQSGQCDGLPFFGMPGDTGICGAASGGAFSISPRTCGFGPLSSGKDKDGIVPPAMAQSIRLPVPRRWFAFPD